MKVLGTVTANSYQIVTNGDEAIGSMLSSDSKRGGRCGCHINRRQAR